MSPKPRKTVDSRFDRDGLSAVYNIQCELEDRLLTILHEPIFETRSEMKTSLIAFCIRMGQSD
ncbi:hypothetical protein DFQ01_106112 [Paenibacillus cellulosilyticus]|uniref:Uncharacterized protein n=1 Tax=Paenibacillus cellulosilyticus TaxID=375489 RepID=A0A2V2YXB8_9BACL|nr:hypothetical protein DFQ01_106112 [Paenibacillus cellulosilyticus]